MDMDLSWSASLKADAPTLAKDLRKEIKKHMDLITTNMCRMDNIVFALRNGESTLRGVLCKGCKDAIKSKRSQIHSGNEPSFKKRVLKMLPPERLQIVNEITNMLIQFERSKSDENVEVEFCTEKEYYEQEMMEMKQQYQSEIDKLEFGMKNMKEKHQNDKKESNNLLRKLTAETERVKERNEALSKQLHLFAEKESELRTLKRNESRLKSMLDASDKELKVLRRDAGRWEKELQWECKELERVKKQFKELESKCDDHLQTNERLEEDIQKITEENTSLAKSLSEFKEGEAKNDNSRLSDSDSFESEPESISIANEEDGTCLKGQEMNYNTESIGELPTERQALHGRIKDFIETNEKTSNRIGRLKQEIDRLRHELDEKKIDFDKVLKENERHANDMIELQTGTQTLHNTLTRTKDEMLSTIERLQLELGNLSSEFGNREDYIDRIEKENVEYVGDVSELQKENKTLLDQRNTLTSANEEMVTTLEAKQSSIDKLAEELERKNNELHSALEENRRLKRKSLVMRLLRSGHCGLGKTIVDTVTQDLTRRLDGRFDSRLVDFSVVHNDLSACTLPGILFAVCLNQPNIVRHIENVLQNMKGPRDVHVLVISNTTKESLAHLTPTRDRVSSELQPSGGIIDMAFSSDGGLYECDLNKSAINKIEAILNKT